MWGIEIKALLPKYEITSSQTRTIKLIHVHLFHNGVPILHGRSLILRENSQFQHI